MDWLNVACDNIDDLMIYNDDENIMAMNIYKYIGCVDIILESISQMNKVLGVKVTNPLINRTDIFNGEKYSLSDRKYFKMIRAAFGSHAVDIKFDDNKNSTCYASWPCFPFDDNYDAYVYLYGFSEEKSDIKFGFKFNDINRFCCALFEMLDDILGKIKEICSDYIFEMKNTIIQISDCIYEDIDILHNESQKRGMYYLFDSNLSVSKCLFDNLKKCKDKKIQNYLKLLVKNLEDIYSNLQDMNFKKSNFESIVFPEYDYNMIGYDFSKLYESVFTEYPKIYNREKLKRYVKEEIEISDDCSDEELFCLLTIGLYYKKIKYNNHKSAQ